MQNMRCVFVWCRRVNKYVDSLFVQWLVDVVVVEDFDEVDLKAVISAWGKFDFDWWSRNILNSICVDITRVVCIIPDPDPHFIFSVLQPNVRIQFLSVQQPINTTSVSYYPYLFYFYSLNNQLKFKKSKSK